MRKISAIGLLAASLFILVAAGCQKELAVGDSVVALWNSSSWWEGTVGATCEGGFSVKWADGSSPTCIAKANVVANKTPAAGSVKVGDVLLAKWAGSAFYDAKITKADGATYSVEYTSDKSTKDGLAVVDLRLK